jgi:hypothetical protein
MEINFLIIKILVAAGLFGSMIFMKEKQKWIVALILTAYLIMIGAGIF